MSNFYNQASWVLVPSGIEEDVVFAQKPISGLGDLSYTRASDATYTDSTGVVRRSPYNLLQQSEMFSNAIWTKVNSTISIDATVAPNGTLTADKLVATVINDQHRIDQTPTSLATSQTFSVYAKAGEYPAVGLRLGTTGAGFNLATGVVFSTSSGITSSIQSVGNGWYRCSITKATGVSNDIARINISDGVTAASNFAGNGTDGIFIWGAQLVEGTSALDYFPTTNRQDVPRIDFRNADGTLSSCGRLLLEPQRTNSIRNSSMVGAVAGSPGAVPTNWANNNLYGLSRTVVAIGTEDGLPYIDFRFFGTANTTENLRIDLETTTSITASTGQAWTFSTYAKTISGTTPTSQFFIVERTIAGTFITQGATSFVPTSTLTRFSATRTLSGGATVGAVQPLLMFAVTSGVSYDFTIRIAAPQMELGAYATTWVPTTTAAVTRLIDVTNKTGISSLIGQTEGVLFIDFVWNGLIGNGSFPRIIEVASDSNNIIQIYTLSGTTTYKYEVINGGVVQFTGTSTMALGQNKIAIAYKLNDMVVYRNGALVASDTSCTVPATSALGLTGTFNGTGGAQLAASVTQAALFPTRLTNAQMQELTTL